MKDRKTLYGTSRKQVVEVAMSNTGSTRLQHLPKPLADHGPTIEPRTIEVQRNCVGNRSSGRQCQRRGRCSTVQDVELTVPRQLRSGTKDCETLSETLRKHVIEVVMSKTGSTVDADLSTYVLKRDGGATPTFLTNDFKFKLHPAGKVSIFWVHYSSVAVCQKPKAITRAGASISNNLYIIRVSTRRRYVVEIVDLDENIRGQRTHIEEKRNVWQRYPSFSVWQKPEAMAGTCMYIDLSYVVHNRDAKRWRCDVNICHRHEYFQGQIPQSMEHL
jgi:hypothetical protein